MADEKILKDEVLSDSELDNVAGGTFVETMDDLEAFNKRGIDIFQYKSLTELMNHYGYKGFEEHSVINGDPNNFVPDMNNANVYVNKNGQRISRETFWKNFDAENGTHIIK